MLLRAVGLSLLAWAGLAVGLTWSQSARPAPPPAPKAAGGPISDVEPVERVLAARREYQISLEQLRAHYLSVGDHEKARRAEEELLSFHRSAREPYNLGLDVPAPTLQPLHNIPEANKLYSRGKAFKDKARGVFSGDASDNLRRAELVFQQLITSYPQSDKIDDAAYQLGEIYESRAYRQYRRAALYYERCFQWNPKTHLDARLRAAHLYDKVLSERGRAIELYQEVVRHDTDPKRLQEANNRLAALRSSR